MFSIALAWLLAVAPAPWAPPPQDVVLPKKLLEASKVHLVNDLQAWAESMLVFREFRREMRRIDQLEEVGSREDADIVAVLSGDPNIVETRGLVNTGIPYPSGYTSSRIMLLVVFDAETDGLLWFDAVDWDTAGNATRIESHKRLATRLKTALEEAGRRP